MSAHETAAHAPKALLTAEQCRFFDTFGYLVLPGFLGDDTERVIEEFLACFDDFEVDHDGSERSTIIPFIDHRESLRALLEDPRVDGAFTSLLGEDWNYLSSDGNFFTGSTPWHPDVTKTRVKFVKMAIYLDHVDAQSGALRVIPGSHRLSGADAHGHKVREGAKMPLEHWGVEAHDVPSVSLDSAPGDVTLINENIVHGSWGGSTKRRQFTINAFSRITTAEEAEELRDLISIHAQWWMDSMYSEEMIRMAPPYRMKRLTQVLENQGHLPALAEECRASMPGPAMQNRGWHGPTRGVA